MKFNRLAFVDLETTGGSYRDGRITEIGVLLYEGGRLVDEFHTLVNPECFIPKYIMNITGITDKDVLGSPNFSTLSDDLYNFLNGALFIAHNALYDYKFMQNEFRRVGLEYNSPRLCTVKLSKKFFPELRKHNLDAIIEEHCIECSNRHRALDDAKVLPKFYKLLQTKFEDEYFNRTLSNLIEY
jgi:DNA polymerase III subunit epsilon